MVERGVVRAANGVRIHFRRAGAGPPLVLLHGFPQTGHMWRKVLPALAAARTVIAPDLRGYGDSDKPRDGYDKRTMAADIAAVVQALAGQPVALVGHDRGARVAHRFALDHPDLLTHLALLDIAPTYDVFRGTDMHGARERWHWFFQQVPDLPEALTVGREDIYVRFLIRSWAGNPGAIEEEAIQEYVRCARLPGTMRAMFEDYRAAATLDLQHDAADRDRRVKAPTLVLWGESGRALQAADMVGVWRARCERVEGHPIADCGHFLPEEQPEAVLRAVSAFLART